MPNCQSIVGRKGGYDVHGGEGVGRAHTMTPPVLRNLVVSKHAIHGAYCQDCRLQLWQRLLQAAAWRLPCRAPPVLAVAVAHSSWGGAAGVVVRDRSRCPLLSDMRCALVTGRPLDVVVARSPLSPGDVALRVPDRLVVTLDRVFESEGLGERGTPLSALPVYADACVCQKPCRESVYETRFVMCLVVVSRRRCVHRRQT